MKPKNSIVKNIFKELSFSEEELKLIESVFHKVNIKKGELLIHPGDVVDAMYYITNGCLRAFHIDSQGKEHTIQFGIKDWWMSDFTAFFSDEKAIMTVEAIEDSVIYRISTKDKEYLYTEIPKIDRFFRIKLERSFAAFQKRILAGISKTAKERYLDFINTYPDIEKHIKNYHIASFLGITTESLSRIRKELSNH
ncbi:Crp/Fnr family transcriptional regulator [Winogradskyella sp.]|uniref:Crp/Fnr family transcriptional regulator n=1 Tax=Winogradskyella sp. TaxID=1883156 RepID=UPI0025EC42BE|nr:Crp/Fnr family transcriptional regulator [Winogradskyella sp.]MCT4628597.1 Crp/Fnr family transcriptional regulator [Winogradskyella sp.]